MQFYHLLSVIRHSAGTRRHEIAIGEAWRAVAPESQVAFVTLNVPGSNNDTLPWTGRSAPGAGRPLGAG
jgi:hypothetical protein